MTSFLMALLSVVAVVNIILGLIIFSRGVFTIKNAFFGLIALASAVWGLAIIGFYSEWGNQIHWLILTHVSALIIPYCFLVFSVYFPRTLTKSFKPLAIAALPLLFIVYFLFAGDLIIATAKGYTYHIGLGYPIYAYVMIAYFIMGYVFLLRQYSHTDDTLERKQILYVLGGSCIASTLAMIPDLILPYFDIFSLTWLGPIFTLLMVISLFLAMLRYQLFNIKILVTEIVSVMIVIALMLELFLVKDSTELFLKATVLVIVTVFSYILIRSVYREVALREEKEKLADELEVANSHLKELDQMKTEFLSLATHPIRAPITAIKGYASLLIEGNYGVLPDKAKEAVGVIFSSGQNMAIMVDDFLNISRIEEGRMAYQFGDVDAVELTRAVYMELKPTAEKKGLDFSFSVDPALPMKGSHGTLPPLHIWADIDKLRQVILNIVDNSIKYTPKGSTRIYVTRNKKNGMARIEVSDTGIGMTANTISHLFEKFVRAKNAMATNVSGTGLGLYLCKQIMLAHKGKVWAESEGEGKGTMFVIEVPEK